MSNLLARCHDGAAMNRKYESSRNAKSVYLPPDVVTALDNRLPTESLSAALTKRLRRYEALVARTKPPFSDAEMQYIYTALNGYSAQTPENLLAIAAMVKALASAGGQRPMGVDPTSLAYKLEAAPFAVLLAIMERCERNASDAQGTHPRDTIDTARSS